MLKMIILLIIYSFISACSNTSSRFPEVYDRTMEVVLINGGIEIPTHSLVLLKEVAGNIQEYSQRCEKEEKRNCSSLWIQNVSDWYDSLQNGVYTIVEIFALREQQKNR